MIQVIGAGMGRTGTLSLKYALETLGYNKTHHMKELIENSYQLPYWLELWKTRKTDYDAMFKGYEAVVDFPGAIFYKELMAKYPDAKVILTTRDPEKWYKSASDTIFNLPEGFDRFMMKFIGLFKPELKHLTKTLDFAKEAIWVEFFDNSVINKDKAKTIDRYNRWNGEVIATVPKEKLLVMEVKDGWAPLCEFLGKPIPATEFPRVNDTAEFNARKKQMTK